MCPVCTVFTNTGARYNPVTDTWTAMSATGEPGARHEHIAVWTGTRMIVWGGRFAFNSTRFDDGGSYDPQTDTWTATPLTGAPGARSGHAAVWTGNQMLIWGGIDSTGTLLSSGGRYLQDVWTPVAVFAYRAP
jgi:N-acetylneuraminic acid mutarotase